LAETETELKAKAEVLAIYICLFMAFMRHGAGRLVFMSPTEMQKCVSCLATDGTHKPNKQNKKKINKTKKKRLVNKNQNKIALKSK